MPILTVLAGPNGAGKTTLSKYLVEKGFISNLPYNPDVDLEDRQADRFIGSFDTYASDYKKAQIYFFKEACNDAIKLKEDFAFECNLRISQLFTVSLFEEAKYDIQLIYIYLDNIDTSFSRVQHRIEVEKGNFVDGESINVNFESGLKNLDSSFNDWDKLIILNNSKNLESNRPLSLNIALVLEKGIVKFYNSAFSKELNQKLPACSKFISEFVKKNNKKNDLGNTNDFLSI